MSDHDHTTILVLQLPEVKLFITEDFEQKFDRTTLKKIEGKAPEIIFYSKNGTEILRQNIEKYSR